MLLLTLLVQWFYLQIGDESATKPQHHPIFIDDDSNQHLTANNRSSTDIDSDVKCTNNGDKNIVMQDVVGTVG